MVSSPLAEWLVRRPITDQNEHGPAPFLKSAVAVLQASAG